MAAAFDLNSLTLDGVRDGALRGRHVTVLGFARSGTALARFFADAGAEVTIYDARPADALGDAIAALDGRTVHLALGPDIHPATTWAAADLVVTSPSINPDYPTTEPRLRTALADLRDRGVAGGRGGVATAADAPPIVSEADLVLRLCPAPTIGVTGTKGKTTTSALIAAVLSSDPSHPVLLGGNMGDPLIDRLGDITPDHRVVIELSELQLPTLSRSTTVAVYTNVTSDHLDRHGSLEAYRRTKRRLAELVGPRGALVLNGDDPVVAKYAGLGGVPAVTYRRDAPANGGVGVVDGWLVAAGVAPLEAMGQRTDTGQVAWTGRIMPAAEIGVPGRHNVSNALAAAAVGLLFGVEPAGIREAVTAFRGVEHRLEVVAEIDGVRFVNDSQGTQPDAVIAALNAFEPPVILIAGGRDKDVDLSALADVVAQRADAAVLIGESAQMLERLFGAAGLGRIEHAPTLEEAVAVADGLARDRLLALRARGTTSGRPFGPATVLMSPAAASFDMFVDYAARGRAFKAAVADLAGRRGSGGEGSAP